MLTPARMLKADILVLQKDLKAVTEELGKLGILQLIEAYREPETKVLERPDREAEIAECEALRGRLLSLVRKMSIQEKRASEKPYSPMDISSISAEVEKIEEEVEQATGGNGRLDDELEKLKRLISEVETFEGLSIALEDVENLSFIHFAVGSFLESRLGDLKREVDEDVVLIPYRDSDDNEKLISVTKKKGRWALESSLNKYGFKQERISEKYKGVPDEILKIARARLKELNIQTRLQQAKLQGLRNRYADRILMFLKRVEIEKMILEAQKNFSKSWAAYYISGWVPHDKVDLLCRKIIETTDNTAVIEIFKPEEATEGAAEPPVLFSHSKWLRPFQMLVSNYDIPGYNEVEPTLLVAVTFLLMFGIMFSDIGHGSVLLIAGLILRKKAKKPRVKDAGFVIASAGASSMLFGLLFGSVFAFTFTPLWIEPLRTQDMMTILMVTIGLGVVMISTGIIINIINSFLSKDYAGGIFGKFGIVGIIFYWGALGIGIKLALSKPSAMTKWAMFFLIGVPFLILFLREPIHYLLLPKGKKESGGFFIALFEGAVEILEVFTAFLANTMSFVRVGAFALSHAALCLVIFAMLDAVKGMPAETLISVLILIIGNAFIILFEGLVVTIQAIRLEYYEFFTKFFKGGGKEYKPFEIR